MLIVGGLVVVFSGAFLAPTTLEFGTLDVVRVATAGAAATATELTMFLLTEMAGCLLLSAVDTQFFFRLSALWVDLAWLILAALVAAESASVFFSRSETFGVLY